MGLADKVTRLSSPSGVRGCVEGRDQNRIAVPAVELLVEVARERGADGGGGQRRGVREPRGPRQPLDQSGSQRGDGGVARASGVAVNALGRRGAPATLRGHGGEALVPVRDHHRARTRFPQRLGARDGIGVPGRACELVRFGFTSSGRPARPRRNASPSASSTVGTPAARACRPRTAYASAGTPGGRLPQRTTASASGHQRVVRIEECAPLGTGDVGSRLPEAGGVPVCLVDDGERPAGLARDRA